MQPIGKKLVTAMNWQQEPIGKKLALDFFYKKYLCNSIGLFVSPAFLFFLSVTPPLKRLALINHSYFN